MSCFPCDFACFFLFPHWPVEAHDTSDCEILKKGEITLEGYIFGQNLKYSVQISDQLDDADSITVETYRFCILMCLYPFIHTCFKGQHLYFSPGPPL